jgi:hypothetical protein
MFITTEVLVYEKKEEEENNGASTGHSHGAGGHSH